MMLRILSAVSVFVASLSMTIALYNVIAHHPNATMAYHFVSFVAVCVNCLSFAGVWFILRGHSK